MAFRVSHHDGDDYHDGSSPHECVLSHCEEFERKAWADVNSRDTGKWRTKYTHYGCLRKI